MDVRGQTWNRRSLLGSGAIGGVPHQGLGRSLKVGREEIVGLVTALERYVAGSDDDVALVWTGRLDIVAATLGEIAGVVVTRRCPPQPFALPSLKPRNTVPPHAPPNEARGRAPSGSTRSVARTILLGFSDMLFHR
jgi:hypothetical protein